MKVNDKELARLRELVMNARIIPETPMTLNWGGCGSGLCASTCSGACAGGCQGSCSGWCSGGCTGGCSGSCVGVGH